MLYVVAWPVLGEADDTALRRLRAQYHPAEADLIGPHFTLVFGVPDSDEERLRSALAAIARRPFWFMLSKAAVQVTQRNQVFLSFECEEDEALRDLYDILNPSPEAEPFVPHVTLGRFASGENETVMRLLRIVEPHLPMHGRVEELSLLRREGNALTKLLTVALGGG